MAGQPKLDFEKHKDVIHNLYLVEHQPIKDVIQYMKTVYNFDARYEIILCITKYLISTSRATYVWQFRLWGFNTKRATLVNDPELISEVKELWHKNIN